MGTNVNTPFFQVPMPELGHSARARVQGLDRVHRHSTGHRFLVCRRVLLVLWHLTHKPLFCVPQIPYFVQEWSSFQNGVRRSECEHINISGNPVSEHSTILCRYPGPSARVVKVSPYQPIKIMTFYCREVNARRLSSSISIISLVPTICSLRTQTYFRLSFLSARKVTSASSSGKTISVTQNLLFGSGPIRLNDRCTLELLSREHTLLRVWNVHVLSYGV